MVDFRQKKVTHPAVDRDLVEGSAEVARLDAAKI